PEASVAERRLAARDDPPAQRWMDGRRLLGGAVQLALSIREAGVEAAVLRVVHLVEHVLVREGEVGEPQPAGDAGHGDDDEERMGVPAAPPAVAAIPSGVGAGAERSVEVRGHGLPRIAARSRVGAEAVAPGRIIRW